MLNINIICVGKLKEKYLKDALNEYIKFTKNMNNITEKVYQSGSTPFVKIK